MFLEVQRRSALKWLAGLREHSHVEPGIQRYLRLFPVAIRLELSRRYLDRYFVHAITLPHSGGINLQIEEHDRLEQIGNEFLIFRARLGAQCVDQISGSGAR